MTPPDDMHTAIDPATLIERIESRAARIGVIGLGYVGLPLVLAMTAKGFKVTGFDVDGAKIVALNEGRSYIRHIKGDRLGALVKAGVFFPTTDYSLLTDCDAVLICVPTPLTRHREPDLSYVEVTCRAIAPHLRRGQLIILESTTYPGTTRDVMQPILEAGGLLSGRDFFLAFSPEREDPGNEQYGTAQIPKVVGGQGEAALRIAQALYDSFVAATVPVSSPETAEAVKLTENIFRSVNIALVNELKVVYAAMGIDVWEVIDAAKTKPFGFMPFYPGPGLGGHCIPIDPFYLTWKAREYEISTRFIELAGEVNTAMPRYVVDRLAEALDRRFAKGLNGASILVLGVAYKANVDDMRESPSLTIMEMLEGRGARVSFHDPYIPLIPATREHPHFAGRTSAKLDKATLEAADAIFILTDHKDVDYALVAEHARLVVDTRNALGKRAITGENVVKA